MNLSALPSTGSVRLSSEIVAQVTVPSALMRVTSPTVKSHSAACVGSRTYVAQSPAAAQLMTPSNSNLGAVTSSPRTTVSPRFTSLTTPNVSATTLTKAVQATVTAAVLVPLQWNPPPVTETLNKPRTQLLNPVPVTPCPAVVPISPPAAQTAAPVDQPLRLGADVQVSGRWFHITAPLGMGSYGMVWSATRAEGCDVALKEIVCSSETELVNACFEGDLLAKIADPELCRQGLVSRSRRPSQSFDEVSRLPSFVAKETQTLGPHQWRVRLVMTRIPGVPLAVMMEQRANQEVDLCLEPSDVVLRRHLVDPTLFAWELVAQLGPTLEHISLVAYHRDVNPRNILVEVGPDTLPSAPRYGLVDFGMAVEGKSWRSNDAPAIWQRTEVGGDCRYWPVSAWIMFLQGPAGLPSGAPLRLEYQTLLDIHAMGITALQVFMELVPKLPEIPQGGGWELARRIRTLQVAWNRYWKHITDCWRAMLECFSKGGDWNVLKASYITRNMLGTIDQELADIRAALAEAATAGGEGTQKGTAGPNLRNLFLAIRLMIGCSGAGQAPDWRSVRATLGIE